ncbi:IclR family transcriptional regulator [Nocardia jiangxiensis]|uniref:IclR family transcriptional regulator n=1 Tax=Nocardia jiangxiensis TaxID=282685 RepID=A0ABW6RUC4_9NOCA|nr:IclR family transcriptional regulator [Nocardia jiangxiensis]
MAMLQLEETPTAMIDRVASLLESFVGERPLTLAEIARRSHVPRSSAHRILQRLVELGWVQRKQFKYTLGVRMFELGAQFPRRHNVHRAAVPVMADLHRRSGLTVHLSMLVGAEIMHLDRVGIWPTAGGQWSAGARQPVATTAAGRAMLATLPPDQWAELDFEDAPTCYSIRSRNQLARDLDRVRDRGGVAVDSQGTALGVTVVAAPIPTADADADEHFALSLCGPTQTLGLEAAIVEVRKAATTTWRAAAGVPPLRPRPVAATGHGSRANMPHAHSGR